MTMPSLSSHPGACPHCGSTSVNFFEPDIQIREAELTFDADGTPAYTIGDPVDFTDAPGVAGFHCHGCGSDYPVPAGLREDFNDKLAVDYPHSVDKGDRGYLGATLRYTIRTERPTLRRRLRRRISKGSR